MPGFPYCPGLDQFLGSECSGCWGSQGQASMEVLHPVTVAQGHPESASTMEQSWWGQPTLDNSTFEKLMSR